MLGFDIGGTKCAVSVGQEKNGALVVCDKRSFPTASCSSPDEVIERMCQYATELTRDTSRVGISCGGPLDPEQGVILSPPNLPGWEHIEITELVGRRLGARVKLCNDADACALAEWKYGAGQGTRHMVFLTFGTGMGAGLILNGQLYTGACHMAGEIGHIRLSDRGPVGYNKAGSMEGFCSGGGIAALGRMMAMQQLQRGAGVSFCRSEEELPTITAKSIALCAEQGHEDAKEIYRLCGEKLGLGLSMLMDILNPEKIVIGSIYQRSRKLLVEAMQESIQREALLFNRNACEIVPAALTENVGDVAALTVATMIEEA